jgi:hypothetical protein
MNSCSFFAFVWRKTRKGRRERHTRGVQKTKNNGKGKQEKFYLEERWFAYNQNVYMQKYT